MKKIFLIALFVTAAGLATSEAQTRATFKAPAGVRSDRAQRQAPQPTRARNIGAFARAARGNPIQLINPGAPRRYFGPPQDTVAVDPSPRGDFHTRSPITGVILFGLAW